MDCTDRSRGALLIRSLRGFFSAHPLLFLILLSPQVEYFTGSSQLSWAVGNPPLFFLFLVQNLGSYGLAVVLIREAQIRWNKGWASILLLGAAYGIVNEGIGAATLFNPDSSSSGPLGSYGRWLGVNWVWATGLILLVHPLFSVSLPILQHRLAFPGLKGKSLIGNRGLRLAVVGLGIDATATLLFVGTIRHYLAGPILWAGSCGIIAAMIAAAKFAPRNLLRTRTALPHARLVSFFILGAGFIWAITLGADFLIQLAFYPLLVSLFFVALGGLALAWVFRTVGQSRNELHKVSLSSGLVASLIPMGFFGQIGTGIGLVPVIAYDSLFVLFLYHIWKKATVLTKTGLGDRQSQILNG